MGSTPRTASTPIPQMVSNPAIASRLPVTHNFVLAPEPFSHSAKGLIIVSGIVKIWYSFSEKVNKFFFEEQKNSIC
jgi:hypothetical protein